MVGWAFLMLVAEGFVLRGLGTAFWPGEGPHLARAVGAIVFYIVMVAPVWYAARREGFSLPQAVGMRGMQVGPAVLLAALLVPVEWYVGVVWFSVASSLHLNLPGRPSPIEFFGTSTLGVILGFVVAGFVAPIAEEIVFRGVLYAQLRCAWGDIAAVLLSSALFAAIHLNAVAFIPLMFVGIVLALLFRRSGSLWGSIISHGIYNIATFAIALAFTGIGR
jgi:membrane protease YdiL (CAAX protease family)